MNAAGLAVRIGRPAMRQSAARILAELSAEHRCTAPDAEDGYRFSKAMKNPGFIGIDDIQKTLSANGILQF